jgi:hypothetical protein
MVAFPKKSSQGSRCGLGLSNGLNVAAIDPFGILTGLSGHLLSPHPRPLSTNFPGGKVVERGAVTLDSRRESIAVAPVLAP